MPKDKERSINPAQQQRKLEKARALKKSKSELQAKRNEKLARRNPDRIQKQIDDLKALESAGDIKPREKAILADLERDLRAVKKARDTLGEKAPQYGSRDKNDQRTQGGQRDRTLLGKRRYNGERKHSAHSVSGSDTDESTRNIPWPRDTPPPVPKEFRRNKNPHTSQLGERSYAVPDPSHTDIPEARTTYESAPQIRNLTQEAVKKFVPNVVKRKQDAVKGVGGQLLEPEELDKLERAGYVQRTEKPSTVQEVPQPEHVPTTATVPIDADELRRLEEEERRFEMEIAMHTTEKTAEQEDEAEHASLQPLARHVQIEEVEDEDL